MSKSPPLYRIEREQAEDAYRSGYGLLIACFWIGLFAALAGIAALF